MKEVTQSVTGFLTQKQLFSERARARARSGFAVFSKRIIYV